VLILKRVLFEGQEKKKRGLVFWGKERHDEITNRKKEKVRVQLTRIW